MELTRRFGDFTAVDAISFEVPRAEIFGFLGPNGAGKTTTISMLCTLLRPTAGRAFIGGHDVVAEASAVRREIGIIFQDTTLDPPPPGGADTALPRAPPRRPSPAPTRPPAPTRRRAAASGSTPSRCARPRA